MKNLILFSMLVLAIGCGKEIQCEGETCSYVESFKQEAQARGYGYSPTTISFVDDIPGAIGRCDEIAFVSKRIIISRKKWDRATESAKNFVIYHELGHCALGRTHTSELLGRGLPSSLMHHGNELYSTEMGVFFKYNKEYYLNELFTQEQDISLAQEKWR